MVTSEEVRIAREKLRKKHKKYLLMNQEKMDEIKLRDKNNLSKKKDKKLEE